MRTVSARAALTGVVAGVVVLVAGALALAAGKPAPPPGSNRIESFRPNLDPDRDKERVFVYNRADQDQPVSYFEVWDRGRNGWKRGQRRLVTLSPGSPESGLAKAWVGDLNRDGRMEIAVRDRITPSAGEALSIFRQKSEGSRKFRPLQGVGGDRVGVKTRKRKPAYLKVTLMSNHSPDGREHHEIWKWSSRSGQWRCRTDCPTR